MCSICHENFAEGDDLTILPCNNKHKFHQSCIKDWLERKDVCPLCNKKITQAEIDEQRR
jgi:hypothetical protein